jgi:hypothetical protein
LSPIFFLVIVGLLAAFPYARVLSGLYFGMRVVSQRLEHSDYSLYMSKLPVVMGVSYLLPMVLGYGMLWLEYELFGYFWVQLSVLVCGTLFYTYSPLNRFKPRSYFWLYLGVYLFFGWLVASAFLLILAGAVALSRSWVLGSVITVVAMSGVIGMIGFPTEYYFMQAWMVVLLVFRYFEQLETYFSRGKYWTVDQAYFTRY